MEILSGDCIQKTVVWWNCLITVYKTKRKGACWKQQAIIKLEDKDRLNKKARVPHKSTLADEKEREDEINKKVSSVYARYFTKEEYNFSTFRLNVKELYGVLNKF